MPVSLQWLSEIVDKLLSHAGDRGRIWMAACVSGGMESREETAGHGEWSDSLPGRRGCHCAVATLSGSVHVKADMLSGKQGLSLTFLHIF